MEKHIVPQIVKFLTPFTQYPYAGEDIPCPVCDHREKAPIASLDRRMKRLPTVACDACGLLFTCPMPSDTELSQYYSSYYRFDYQLATTEPKERHLRKRDAEAERRRTQIIDLLGPNSRTLDFGCGSGEFVHAMHESGHDAHGFEPGETYGRYAQTLLAKRIKIAGWQEVEYEEPFDLVTSFHVVEHLRDPLTALRQIASWLKPNGIAYIEVPNMGRSPSKGIGGLHFAHVLGFNHYNLLLAAHRVGLKPIRHFKPTSIVFSRGISENPVELATQGRRLSFELFATGSAYRNYFRYQASKLPMINKWSRADRDEFKRRAA